MGKVTRKSISFNSSLLKEFDKLIRYEDYNNRSEAIRDLVRDFIHKKKQKKITAVIRVIYDHRKSYFSRKIAELQHRYHCLVKSSFHTYIGPHKCIEILIVSGSENRIKNLKRKVSSIEEVKECFMEIL